MSSPVLNIQRERDPKTSLSTLFQCFINFTGKKKKICWSRISCASVCVHWLLSWTGQDQVVTRSISLHPSSKYVDTQIRRPWVLLFSSWIDPALSLSLYWQMLKSFNHLCSLLLDLLQYVCFSCAGESRLDTQLQMWPHQHSVKRNGHLPLSASNILLIAAQDVIGIKLHTTACSYSIPCLPEPASPSLQSCFPVGCSSACTGAWGYSSPSAGIGTSRCWNSWDSFLDAYPISVLLNGSTTTWSISYNSQFGIFCKLSEVALCPTIQVINGEVK